ncbi:MAG: DUF2314 domain-containing protein [Spirulina sp. SIO3F2]|nr:DUF2314 domain-containing protein [Spirulina sp. SIO3F2]
MNDAPIYFAEFNQAMVRASEMARQTFKYFWRELSWEYRRIIPGLEIAAIKMPFPVPEGVADAPEVEQMWIGEIEFDGETITGVLLNKPQWLDSIGAGEAVAMHWGDMSDWMYAINGQVYGAYTVNVMRSQMTPSELAQHDAAWGLEFGDPTVIQVTSATQVRLQDNAVLDDVAEPEHPMSENMTEQIKQALAENPTMATTVDESGWSLLHREALAGNLTPVRILLQYGADPTAPNVKGESTIDLAQKMNWPRIVRVLNSSL